MKTLTVALLLLPAIAAADGTVKHPETDKELIARLQQENPKAAVLRYTKRMQKFNEMRQRRANLTKLKPRHFFPLKPGTKLTIYITDDLIVRRNTSHCNPVTYSRRRPNQQQGQQDTQ